MDFIQLKSFNSVAPGQNATLQVDTNRVYHDLQITHFRNGVAATPAQMITDIEFVRILIDGKVQREVKPAELFALLAERDLPVLDGILHIPFAWPHARTALGEDQMAWGTLDVESFEVEVKLASAAVSPALSARALVEPAGVNRQLGAIEKWQRFTVPVAAIGITPWTPNIEPQEPYYEILCFSGNINSAVAKVDGKEVFGGTKEQLEALYKSRGLVPQTNVFSIAWDGRNRVSDALPMRYDNGNKVRDFLVEFDMAAATSFTALTRRVGLRN
jgi:hypothetical protein